MDQLLFLREIPTKHKTYLQQKNLGDRNMLSKGEIQNIWYLYNPRDLTFASFLSNLKEGFASPANC